MKKSLAVCAAALCMPSLAFAGSGAGMAGTYYGNKTIPAQATFQPAARAFPGTAALRFDYSAGYTPVNSTVVVGVRASYGGNNLLISRETRHSYTGETAIETISLNLSSGQLYYNLYDLRSAECNSPRILTRSQDPALYDSLIEEARGWVRAAQHYAAATDKAGWRAIDTYLGSRLTLP